MENKQNQGAIFKNTKKEKESQPDYRGIINVDGVEKQISLWMKTSKDGKTKYFSASISEPYNSEKKEPTEFKPDPKVESKEDDLPF